MAMVRLYKEGCLNAVKQAIPILSVSLFLCFLSVYSVVVAQGLNVVDPFLDFILFFISFFWARV